MIDIFSTENKYQVIYADPPWDFRTYSGKGKGRSASKHYGIPSIALLADIPVRDLADKDCAMFMWVTDPHLSHGLYLMNAWGFEYKTVGFYWAKENRVSPGFFKGMGYWTRANPEMCLLGTRGKPKRLAKDVEKLVVAKRRQHSRKPDEVIERIERLVPGPYIELFARTSRPGWDCWGNETDKF